MKSTTGKTALITGASSGIGQELAKLFAQDGYNLVLVSRNDDKLKQLSQMLKSEFNTQEILVIGMDLSDEDAAHDVYRKVKRKGITIDVLVNDAGVGVYGLFATDTDWEEEKSMLNLNVLTLTQLTKLFLYDMLARNDGKILNLASFWGIVPTPLMAVYAGTKAYVYSFTQSLVNELKDTNVTVTALLPNATDTDFFNKAGAENAKVTDDLQDPAIVAKAGYDALMAGKSKAIPSGLKNKSYELLSHVVPDDRMASMVRNQLEPKQDEKERNSTTMAWGIGIGIAVLAGIAIGLAYATTDEEDREKYRGKAKSLGDSISDILSATANNVVASLLDTYKSTSARIADVAEEADVLKSKAEEEFKTKADVLKKKAEELKTKAFA